jgi:hypothetical protein
MNMFRSSRRQPAFDFDLLLPETPVRRASRPTPANNDVVDADFVTVTDTPKHDHGNDNRNRRYQQTVKSASALSTIIGRFETALGKLSVDAYSAVVALAVVIVFAFSGGFTFVSAKHVPAVSQMSPLDISHVTITPQDAGGMEVLLITGVVENNGSGTLALPAIRADMFAANGQLVASMLIDPPVRDIGSQHSHGFSAKLRHPGGKTPEVKLSFVETGVSGS